MPAGGPSDHPLTDILKFDLDVYNNKCDELIRKVSKYVSNHELYEMFEWLDNITVTKEELAVFEKKLSQKLTELESNADSNGWEKKD